MTSIIGSCVAGGIVVVSDIGETRRGNSFSTRDNKVKPIRPDGNIGYPAGTDHSHDVVVPARGFICYAGIATYGDDILREFSSHLREHPNDMDFNSGLEALESIYSSFIKRGEDFNLDILLGGYSSGQDEFYLGVIARDNTLPLGCRRVNSSSHFAIGSKNEAAETWIGRRLEVRGDRGHIPKAVGARISLEAREEVSRRGGSAIGDVQLAYFNGSDIHSYDTGKGNLLFLATQMGNLLLQKPVITEGKVEETFSNILERGLSARDAFGKLSTKTKGKMLREIALNGGMYRTGSVDTESETL